MMNKYNNFIATCMSHPKWIIASVSLLAFLPLFTLKLWIIDDHEIVWFLTALNTDGWTGFWHQWLQLPDFGTMPRFRPVYYLLRAIETLLWRDNAFLWVFARLLIVFVFALSIFKLSRRFFSEKIALVFSLSTICVPWLSGTFYRLGPSEAYAVLFTALLIFSLLPKRDKPFWLGVAFSVAMLVGIKENFIILIPLAGWAVYELIRERKYKIAFLASIFLAFSLGCVVVLAYKLHISSGVDVYHNSVGAGRINGAINGILYTRYGWFSIILLSVSVMMYVLLNKKGEARKFSLIVLLLCITILVFNLYFYGGVPSIRTRYAFPYWIILLGMPVVLTVQLLTSESGQKWLSDKRYISNLLSITIFIILLGLFVQNISKGNTYSIRTNYTYASILEIMVKSQYADEVIVRTISSFEYEPVFAISRFLKFKGLSKPLFLSVGDNSDKQNGLPQQLLQGLRSVEINGGSGYSPKSEMNKNNTNCLEVVFQARAPNICPSRVQVRY